MKSIILSIYIIFLSIFFLTSPISAQEDTESEQQVTLQQENVNEEKDIEEQKTVAEELEEETLTPKLSFGQILISVLAPTTFIVIAYLLIKKFKL